jgi:hypothetical protein
MQVEAEASHGSPPDTVRHGKEAIAYQKGEEPILDKEAHSREGFQTMLFMVARPLRFVFRIFLVFEEACQGDHHRYLHVRTASGRRGYSDGQDTYSPTSK